MEISLKEKLIKYLIIDGEFSFIIGNEIYISKHILPIKKFFLSVLGQKGEDSGKFLLEILTNPNIVIFGGSVYYLEKLINVKTAIQKLKSELTRNLDIILKENSALINLFNILSINDIIELSENGISFYLLDGKLYAIKYLSEYVQKYNNKKWKFPGCTLGIYIDNQLRLGNVVVLKPKNYIHPFVYTTGPPYKICLGTFYDSCDAKKVKSLALVNSLIMLFMTAIQILVSGYDRNVSPANGHLTDEKYDKYLIN